jgi:nucleoside-diphosphate-sugar epimerase
MQILLTGATGFIGGHLCRRLVDAGHSVLALVRDPKRASFLPASGVETLAGDLTIFDRPDLELPRCDVVIHMAAVVTAKRPDQYEIINFRAVKSLVDCLARQSWKPRRMLFASSLAAAGPSAQGVRKVESDVCDPIDDYGRAKLAAEIFLRDAPFPTTAFRPSVVFGPRDPATLTFFRLAVRGWGFRVGGPLQTFSFIDVDDLVEGIMRMADDASTEHRTYFVSSDHDADSSTLWDAFSSVLDRRIRVLVVPRPALYGASVASTALAKVFRFKNQLDRKQYDQLTAPAFICSSKALQDAHAWKPRLDLHESLRKALHGYKADGWL